jgi:hypothetical protein
MVCNKFEESGLLYVSGELSQTEAREYETHIAACEECRRETEAYRLERAELYTADLLSESPGPATDAEILRVCSNVRKAPITLTPMLFLKKYAPIPVFLMLVMVAVGGYFRYHSMTANSLVSKYGGDVAPSSSPVDSDGIQASPVNDEKLALSDSNETLSDTNAPFSKNRGNMNLEGVVTVKGEGER